MHPNLYVFVACDSNLCVFCCFSAHGLNFNVFNALKKKTLLNLKKIEIQENFYKFDKNDVIQLLKENTSLISLKELKLGSKQHFTKDLKSIPNLQYLSKFN